MKHKDKKIKSLSELIKYLKKDISNYKGPVWYRGQSVFSWTLTPSYYRITNPPNERNLIDRFVQNATLLTKPLPKSLIDWLFIMQHYGIQTRLLDWTESPLIGTYFAVNEKPNKDAVLWILLPLELNKLSNITIDYLPSIEDKNIETYKPESLSGENTSELYPVAFISPRNSERMLAQLSIFTINHRDKTPIENLGNKRHVWRYIIPKNYKNSIKRELKLLTVSEFQLFPELSSIGHMIKE